MPDVELGSEDARFRIHIPGVTMRRILRICRCSGRLETGGILVGQYSAGLDCARVRAASGPPPDSERGPTWFQRGTRGLQAWLDRQWESQRGHYLGEWHFHPHAAPIPSTTDRRQLESIASTASYGCPEPLLLIVGGDPSGRWSVSAHVFPRGRPAVPLTRDDIGRKAGARQPES